MREIETDYLVVGAGASAMAFVDAVMARSDAEFVIVDRRHRPGGHWLDAYPFVRIHQTSANYGVDSRVLGNDRIDGSGPNAGFYERATAPEICDYFNRVMEDDFIPSGRVRFFAMSDYRGEDADGHHVVSLLTGEQTTVKVRRKLVDATYIASEIPSRHTAAFEVDPDIRLIPPNDLVDLAGPASGYTVIGAGKTSMDTCNWLLEQGVAPDSIRWIRCRDPWVMNRAFFQPLELVGSYMEFQAKWIAAVAAAESGPDFARRLGEDDVFLCLDPDVEPEAFRGAILSPTELESLRRIENVVRLGKVRRIATSGVTLDDGSIASDPGQVYVDCTAAGFRSVPVRPIFQPDRITMQTVTLGIVPWSATTIGVVEALRTDDADKNRLCPPIDLTGRVTDMFDFLAAGMSGVIARGSEPDIAAWNESSRLNPARGAADHLDDPRVPAAFASMGANIGPAIANLEQRVRAPSASPA
jgi:hypothetical protein